jgi:hypothetical protein
MNKHEQKRARRKEREITIRSFIKENPTAGAQVISRATGIPQSTVGFILKKFKPASSVSPDTIHETKGGRTDNADPKTGFTLDSGVSRTIQTLDQLLDAAKVDRNLWTVERYAVNKYDVVTKNEDGNPVVSKLFQVKATLVPVPGKAQIEALRGLIEDLKVEAKKTIPPASQHCSSPKSKLAAEDPVLLEISPFDLHHGKLSWGKETGVPYDAKLSASVFRQAVETLWNRAQAFPVRRVLLVLGQDFFTADNSKDETTAGTPQHVDSRFAKNFRSGWQMMRDAVEFLRARCSGGVDVMIVPGNHDTDSAFCAGEILVALYEHATDVRVDNGPSPRKYFRYGTNLIGFAHGNNEKHAQLPLLMASECQKDWGETTTHEFHVGHLHHSRSTTFVSGNEYTSVRVRILPSLSAADAWHTQKGYLARRAAEAYLWAEKGGYLGHLSWSPS